MKNEIPQDLIDQYGFTLIELMISLVLGLLISAAVMQVFLTSQRVDRIQTAGFEIQDKAVFGLQSIESQVRLANLGNDGIAISDTVAMGGIVLTAGNYDGGDGDGDGDGDDDDEDDDDEDNEDEDEDNEDEDNEDEDKKKKKLEKDAKKLDKDADKLENQAVEKEEKAQKEEKKGNLEKAAEKRAEAAEKIAKAAAKRAEAERKRQEAAQIGNNRAYSFRPMPTPEFQRADYRVSDFQRADFQRADFQRLGFQPVGFQRVASSSSSGPYNVMVKGGLATGYLTRSNSMTSGGSDNKWDSSLSNTNKPSDQLTIQYINTTGRSLYDCEGSEIAEGERVITRYFVADGGGTGNNARKNLDLRCDAGRIKSDGTLEGFTDKGQVVIENIDQFNVRLGVQRTLVNNGALSYQYADMTVADYMALGSGKPAITNIRIAILARSTANSPEASGDDFDIFGIEQTLKDQDNPPKYLRRVYESNILLRNARVMRIIETSIV